MGSRDLPPIARINSTVKMMRMVYALALICLCFGLAVQAASIDTSEEGQASERFFGLFWSLAHCRGICAAANFAATTTCTVWWTNTIACNLLGYLTFPLQPSRLVDLISFKPSLTI